MRPCCKWQSLILFYGLVIFPHIYAAFSSSVHLSMDGCSRVLAIVNNAAANVGGQTPFWVSVFVFFRWKPRSGVVFLFLIFWGTPAPFSAVAAPVCIPTNGARGFPFLRILAHAGCFLVFTILAILTGVRWYLIVSICIFLMVSDVQHLFTCLLAVVCLLRRNASSDLLPIFWWNDCYCCWAVWVLYLFLL